MKFFLDTANPDEIRLAQASGLLDGVTTNPTLIAREKRPFEELVAEIASIVKGPVCLEVISPAAEGMVEEAERLVGLVPAPIVKIPAGSEGFKAVQALRARSIQTVVTLCFSPLQALLAAKSGATYVAPFVGRLDDIGVDGMEVLEEMKSMLARYGFPTMILAASIRSPVHVLRAARLGIDAVTMPYGVFSAMARHPLTDAGLERFMADWKRYMEPDRRKAEGPVPARGTA
jgi:transaldolase